MKKIVVGVFGILALLLMGCEDQQQVEALRQQNAVLEQQISEQREALNTANTEVPPAPATAPKNTYTETSVKSNVVAPTPKPVYNNTVTNNSFKATTDSDDSYDFDYDDFDYDDFEDVVDDYVDYEDDYDSGCCKVCSKWKACGDSCISRDYTCHKGPGCACDG